MSAGQGPDDGARVDVEAAWAQIVLHWDDDASGNDVRGGEPPHAATGPPSPRPASSAPLGSPPAEPPPPGPIPFDLAPSDPATPDPARRVGDRTPPGVGDDLPGPTAPPVRPQGDRRSRRVVRPGEPEPGRPAAVDWDASTSRVGGDRAAERAGYDSELDDALDQEGYIPADPPPLPRGDLISWLAWGGVLGAPLFLLLAALFWRSAPSVLVAAAVVAFVAGFGTLVVRMPDRGDEEDDGAVV